MTAVMIMIRTLFTLLTELAVPYEDTKEERLNCLRISLTDIMESGQSTDFEVRHVGAVEDSRKLRWRAMTLSG